MVYRSWELLQRRTHIQVPRARRSDRSDECQQLPSLSHELPHPSLLLCNTAGNVDHTSLRPYSTAPVKSTADGTHTHTSSRCVCAGLIPPAEVLEVRTRLGMNPPGGLNSCKWCAEGVLHALWSIGVGEDVTLLTDHCPFTVTDDEPCLIPTGNSRRVELTARIKDDRSTEFGEQRGRVWLVTASRASFVLD
jgi:hypothetical protein